MTRPGGRVWDVGVQVSGRCLRSPFRVHVSAGLLDTSAARGPALGGPRGRGVAADASVRPGQSGRRGGLRGCPEQHVSAEGPPPCGEVQPRERAALGLQLPFEGCVTGTKEEGVPVCRLALDGSAAGSRGLGGFAEKAGVPGLGSSGQV